MEIKFNREFTMTEEADISCFDFLDGERTLEEKFCVVTAGPRTIMVFAIANNEYLVTAHPEGLATVNNSLKEACEAARDFANFG
jgi:hypothetical protein